MNDKFIIVFEAAAVKHKPSPMAKAKSICDEKALCSNANLSWHANG